MSAVRDDDVWNTLLNNTTMYIKQLKELRTDISFHDLGVEKIFEIH